MIKRSTTSPVAPPQRLVIIIAAAGLRAHRAVASTGVATHPQKGKIAALVFLAIVLSGLPSGHAKAASFPCSAAKTFVEHAICDTPILSAQDEAIAAAYKVARQGGPDAALSAQRAWLTSRNNCRTVQCLRKSYEDRLYSVNLSAELVTAAIRPRPAQWYLCAFGSRHWQLDLTDNSNRLFADGKVYPLHSTMGSMSGALEKWSVVTPSTAAGTATSAAEQSTFVIDSHRPNAAQLGVELQTWQGDVEISQKAVCRLGPSGAR